MPARVLIFCGLSVVFEALPSATATSSPQTGFMATSPGKASTLTSVLRLLEHGGRERLERVEAELFAAFQSAPKTEFGRIAPHSARHLLQVYFLKEHGWQLTGLEPHGFVEDVSHAEDMALLHDEVPALALALTEAGSSPHGLALGDVASLVVTTERLIYDHYLDLLQSAYRVNGFSPSDTLTTKKVDLVMRSLLLAFNTLDEKKVDVTRGSDPIVERIILFVHDTILNDRFAPGLTNPFRGTALTFEDVTQVADRLIGGYGILMNQDCLSIRDHLQPLSSHGLVPLDEFLSRDMEALGHVFTDTMDYLEVSGVLDPATKRVRLANYMAGPSNCFHTSRYFGICCMNECDSVTHEIMQSIQRPEAPPEHVAAVVANISSRYVEAPRTLSQGLLSRLEEIAKHHDGLVQLHSRFFAQWLHVAFPGECPFPHIAGNKTALQIEYWDDDEVKSLSTEDETVRQRQKQAAAVAEQARQQPRLPHLWIDKDVLYLGLGRRAGRWWSSLKWLAAFAVLLVVGRHLAHLSVEEVQRSAWTRAVGDKAKMSTPGLRRELC